MKKIVSVLISLACLGAILVVICWVLYQVWGQFKLLTPTVSVALLTGATTVLVSTLTVVLGKYYERTRDIEAHYRSKKVEIYDEFLCELFKLFNETREDKDAENTSHAESLVAFLREWHRKMILWGGQDVLRNYILWLSHLKKGVPDVQSMLLMEKVFLEIRKDLGHKNYKLNEGTFISLMLKNPDLFMKKSKENPNITLEELAKFENDPLAQ